MKATGSRAEVMHGVAKHTSGGLPKASLKKGKDGEIKSKKMIKRGKDDPLKAWRAAVAKARKSLGTQGFEPLRKDSELYKLSKKFYGK